MSKEAPQQDDSQEKCCAGSVREGEQECIPVDFTTLVLSLHESALEHLGINQEGATPDLENAQIEIDLLGVLEDKTRGNLNAEEERLLKAVLYELRTTYVRVRTA